ncbi:hypothetical protein [Micromonospora sp. NPDC050276]|uniref:hypothetical protein n=1 Tax=Micromonospora sp. NPDC050276 TaxID=3364278 RepID=UPI0037B06555
MVVENVRHLLSSSAEDRQILFQILWQAVERWASPLGGGVAPFTVLLLCDNAEEAAAVRQEVANASGRSREGATTHPFHS